MLCRNSYMRCPARNDRPAPAVAARKRPFKSVEPYGLTRDDPMNAKQWVQPGVQIVVRRRRKLTLEGRSLCVRAAPHPRGLRHALLTPPSAARSLATYTLSYRIITFMSSFMSSALLIKNLAKINASTIAVPSAVFVCQRVTTNIRFT